MFPELAITGYPPEDLVLKPGFVADEPGGRSARWPRAPGRCAAVVGFVDADRDLHNAAAVCADGRRRRPRTTSGSCPTTPCSTRPATFTPGVAPLSLVRDRRRAGRRVDLRGRGARPGPIAEQAAGGAELVVNINALAVLPRAATPSGSAWSPPGPRTATAPSST